MSRVQILKDSSHPNGRNRFTTFLIEFPKCLLAELNTHRTLVRNCASSRAIPVTKIIDKVLNEPFVPIFSRNQRGMVGADTLSIEEQVGAHAIWQEALENAVASAERLHAIDIHKEAANRLLEPFMSVPVVLSGTQFEPFFALRDAPDAQKSFASIAKEMHELYDTSTPQQLSYGDWHIPFDNYFPAEASLYDKLRIATARIARTSYENHGGDHTIQKDFDLYEMLWSSKHMCYDAETEILTNTGWKLFSLLTPGDKVYAVDPVTLEGSFEVPAAIHNYDYKGELYNVSGQQLDMTVTPNHRMFVASRLAGGRISPWRIMTAADIDTKPVYYLKSTEKYHSSNVEVDLYTHAFWKKDISVETFFKIIGFFLGDGYLRSKNTVGIRVKKPKKIEYLRKLLSTTPIMEEKVTDDGMCEFVLTYPNIEDWFRNYCYHESSKYLNTDLSTWNKHSWLCLKDGLVNSDGSVRRKTHRYSTTSKILADVIQSLGHMFGEVINLTSCNYSNNRPGIFFTLNFSNRVRVEVSPRQRGRSSTYAVSNVPYTGSVWCVTTSTGLVMVRKNNKVVISGNSPFEHCAQVVDNEKGKYIYTYNAFGEENVDISIRSYLPDNLQDYLFLDKSETEFKWTRQYAGFYTLRSQLEDEVKVGG